MIPSTVYGIKPVQQRFLGCFPAVMAMLTGIDHDLLPNITMDVIGEKPVDGHLHLSTLADLRRFYKSLSTADKGPIVVTYWQNLRRMYRENYRVNLSLTRKRPKVFAGRIFLMPDQNASHIAIDLLDGNYIDPNFPWIASPLSLEGIVPLSMWIVATPLQV